MAAPRPAPGVFHWRRFLVLIEAREVDAPDVFLRWGQRTVIAPGEPRHSLPRKSQFNSPAAIAIIVFVHRPIYENRGLLPREGPVERTEARSTRRSCESDS